MVKISEYKTLLDVDDIALEKELKRWYSDVLGHAVWFAHGLTPLEEEKFQGSEIIENFGQLQQILRAHDNNVTKTLSILIERKAEIVAHLQAITGNKKYGRRAERAQQFLKGMQRIPERFEDIVVELNNDSIFGNFKGEQIETHYDSDPFDYRDSSFLHEDGSPADFGDVVEILGSRSRRIHTEPAESEKGQNPTQVLLFNDPRNGEYQEKVVQKIKEYCHEMNLDPFIIEPLVSAFSGPMRTEKAQEAHHDVMACMPGHHIWPDGTIAYQNLGIGYLVKNGIMVSYEDPGAPKGSRPTPTGQKLFHLA